MVTLLKVYSGDKLAGRCDARCYNAKGPVCTCCCGGVNHGKGLQQATENMEIIAGELMRGIEEQEDVPARVETPAAVQLALAGM